MTHTYKIDGMSCEGLPIKVEKGNSMASKGLLMFLQLSALNASDNGENTSLSHYSRELLSRKLRSPQ